MDLVSQPGGHWSNDGSHCCWCNGWPPWVADRLSSSYDSHQGDVLLTSKVSRISGLQTYSSKDEAKDSKQKKCKLRRAAYNSTAISIPGSKRSRRPLFRRSTDVVHDPDAHDEFVESSKLSQRNIEPSPYSSICGIVPLRFSLELTLRRSWQWRCKDVASHSWTNIYSPSIDFQPLDIDHQQLFSEDTAAWFFHDLGDHLRDFVLQIGDCGFLRAQFKVEMIVCEHWYCRPWLARRYICHFLPANPRRLNAVVILTAACCNMSSGTASDEPQLTANLLSAERGRILRGVHARFQQGGFLATVDPERWGLDYVCQGLPSRKRGWSEQHDEEHPWIFIPALWWIWWAQNVTFSSESERRGCHS